MLVQAKVKQLKNLQTCIIFKRFSIDTKPFRKLLRRPSDHSSGIAGLHSNAYLSHIRIQNAHKEIRIVPAPYLYTNLHKYMHIHIYISCIQHRNRLKCENFLLYWKKKTQSVKVGTGTHAFLLMESWWSHKKQSFSIQSILRTIWDRNITFKLH